MFRSADIAAKNERQKKKRQEKGLTALDFPKLLHAPNTMIRSGLFAGAGRAGMLHWSREAGSPLLHTHSGANTFNL